MSSSRDSGMISMIGGKCVTGRGTNLIPCHHALIITTGDLRKNPPFDTKGIELGKRAARSKFTENNIFSLLPALRAALYGTSSNRLSKLIQECMRDSLHVVSYYALGEQA